MHVILLGPCFKTGSLEALRQHPVAAVPEGRSSHPPQTAGRHGRGINPRFSPARLSDADQPHGACSRPSGRHKPGRTHSLQTVPPQQFQALFDSLFKVLFIFPSRYLFAIGLPPVFSLRWDLPPALGCIPKQPDSAKAPRAVTHRQPTGFSPSGTPPSRGLGPAGPQRWLL
jgi:hypothetical protein